MISLLYKCNQTKERNNWDSTDKQECVRWRIPSRGKKKKQTNSGKPGPNKPGDIGAEGTSKSGCRS